MDELRQFKITGTTVTKSPSERSSAIFGAFIGLAIVLYAHSAIAAQFYSIAGRSSDTVNEWSDCRRVINASDQETIFVPANTSAEWPEFRIHYPSGISLAACDWIPNYSYQGHRDPRIGRENAERLR